MKKYSLFLFILGGLVFVCPAFAATADHLVISQIQITGGPGNTSNDFIELYNPTSVDIDLDGYRLVKRTKTGTTDSPIKSWTSSAVIKAHGYFLWANSGYTGIGVTPNATTTATIAADNGVALRQGASNTGTIIDSVGWGEATNAFVEGTVFATSPDASQSLERKPTGSNGNGEDSNDNSADFVLKVSANPRNSQSPIAPPLPTPTPTPTSSPSPSPSESPSPPPPPEPAAPPAIFNLEFSEILPNAAGKDDGNEWVEIYNPGGANFDLSGWFLDDYDSGSPPGSSAMILPAGTTVEGRKYLMIIIPANNFSLTNSRSDGVKLFDKWKNLKLMQSYPADAKDGHAYAKTASGEWKWTAKPTPGAENKFEEAKEPQTAADQTRTEADNSSLPNPPHQGEGNPEPFLPLAGVPQKGTPFGGGLEGGGKEGVISPPAPNSASGIGGEKEGVLPQPIKKETQIASLTIQSNATDAGPEVAGVTLEEQKSLESSSNSPFYKKSYFWPVSGLFLASLYLGLRHFLIKKAKNLPN